MLQLSQKTIYALAFLSTLSSAEPRSLNSISRLKGLPYRFLSQIATNLVQAGIVKSKEGKGGGYFLAKNLKTVDLYTLVNLTEEPIGFVECQRGKLCSNTGCQPKVHWDTLQSEVIKLFKSYTVADFCS